jgi:hypothetical protein
MLMSSSTIGQQFAGQRQRLLAGTCSTVDGELSGCIERKHHALPEKRMVIDDEDSD